MNLALEFSLIEVNLTKFRKIILKKPDKLY